MGATFPDPIPNNMQFSDNDLSQVNDDYIKVIRKLSNLLPIECKDKLKALEELIIYVSSILYGDDLHQFYAYNYYKKYVIKALDELVIYVQEHSLAQYKQELDLLRVEIESCLSEKSQYLREIDALKSEKELLQKQIDDLKIENQVLLDENTSIKTSIDKNSAMMQKIVGNNQVAWEEVKEGDPIYFVTAYTINSYISELKKAYMSKLGISEEECESDFILNSSGLYEIKRLLGSFENHDNNNKTIYYCINSYSLLGIDCHRGSELDKLMQKVKLPKIIERTPTLPVISLTNNSENLNGLLRELYYQKIAFESLAKQKITEAQLYSLIMSLKQIVPENYDFTQYTEVFDENPIMQLLEDNNQQYIKKKTINN